MLSFGIVGDLVYLYTIGNENEKGYADFINSELIEGHSDTSQYTSEENESTGNSITDKIFNFILNYYIYIAIGASALIVLIMFIKNKKNKSLDF